MSICDICDEFESFWMIISMEEVEEMLRRGHSLSEVIKHFMTPNTTEKEKLDALISNLNDEGRLHLIFPINLNPKVHNLIPP